MAQIHYLPAVSMAENKLLEIGGALEILHNIPMAELDQVDLSIKGSSETVTGYEALMRLGKSFYELAYAVRAYNQAQAFKADIMKNGRLP